MTEPEMAQLIRLVNAYLDVAEDMAQRKIPMTMQDRLFESDFYRLLKQIESGGTSAKNED